MWLAVSGFMVMGLISRLSLANHSDSESFMVVQPRWLPARILGGGQTCVVSFWPFLNSSGWWRLISPMFLTRTSYHKTTHVNSYYGAWPGYMGLFIPMNSMKRQNDRILKEELPRSVGAQYATGDQWRNNSRKNEGMEPKQKQCPVVDVTADRSNVLCCKEQYCIGT